MSEILKWCERKNASDLHVQAGKPLSVRVDGQLSRVPANLFPPLDQTAIYELIDEAFSPQAAQAIRERLEHDLSFYHDHLRYRANFSKQRGVQSFSFRVVPQHRQTLEALHLPGALADLVREPRGLLLVTGPTGQGKSTTLRALIQHLNETAELRIITIEDPIEYVFEDYRSTFEQREVGIDTDSFAAGIRNAMRQDPNVIFVGEIRDRESIFASMQAAETGHLVLTTLHADSVPQAIGRIREFYPSTEQHNISSLLARNLNAILCQRLIPGVDGRRLPCLELMRRDRGVQDAIAANDLHQLGGIIEAAVGQGMHSFDQYLIEMLAAGQITEQTAQQFAVNKHRLEMMLRGIVVSAPILEPDK